MTKDAHNALVDIQSGGRAKELLAQVLYDFLVTVKASPHECVIRTVNLRHRLKLKTRPGFIKK